MNYWQIQYNCYEASMLYNPLQCSCLENPRDRGAWWAAVYGVAQSRTRLKQLSTHSMHVIQGTVKFKHNIFLPERGKEVQTPTRVILKELCVCVCVSRSAVSDSVTPPGSSVQGIFQARVLEYATISFSWDLPDPGIEPTFPALQVDSLLWEILSIEINK